MEFIPCLLKEPTVHHMRLRLPFGQPGLKNLGVSRVISVLFLFLNMRELPAKQLSLIDFKHRLGDFLKVTVGNIPSRIACQSLLLQSAVVNGNIRTTVNLILHYKTP